MPNILQVLSLWLWLSDSWWRAFCKHYVVSFLSLFCSFFWFWSHHDWSWQLGLAKPTLSILVLNSGSIFYWTSYQKGLKLVVLERFLSLFLFLQCWDWKMLTVFPSSSVLHSSFWSITKYFRKSGVSNCFSHQCNTVSIRVETSGQIYTIHQFWQKTLKQASYFIESAIN